MNEQEMRSALEERIKILEDIDHKYRKLIRRVLFGFLMGATFIALNIFVSLTNAILWIRVANILVAVMILVVILQGVRLIIEIRTNRRHLRKTIQQVLTSIPPAVP